MFLFQIPYLSEMYLRSDDLAFVEAMFTDKCLGAKSGTFKNEDIEAFKYYLAQPGRHWLVLYLISQCLILSYISHVSVLL